MRAGRAWTWRWSPCSPQSPFSSLPLPTTVVSIVSPARVAYARAASLDSSLPSLLPLTLDRLATLHAWLATLCVIATFWIARAIFARGGIRTVITALAWIAVAFVLVALAQSAASSTLVYGFWRPGAMRAHGRSARSSTAIMPERGACSP